MPAWICLIPYYRAREVGIQSDLAEIESRSTNHQGLSPQPTVWFVEPAEIKKSPPVAFGRDGEIATGSVSEKRIRREFTAARFRWRVVAFLASGTRTWCLVTDLTVGPIPATFCA